VRARDAQVRMLEIESHDQEFDVQDFLTWVAKLDDDPNDVREVITDEVRRTVEVVKTRYTPFRGNPMAMMAVAFMQGATFAAAALGRETWEEEHRDGATV